MYQWRVHVSIEDIITFEVNAVTEEEARQIVFDEMQESLEVDKCEHYVKEERLETITPSKLRKIQGG